MRETAMEENSLKELIRQTIQETLPGAQLQGLGDDDDLFLSGLDSINAVTLIFALQQRLGVEFAIEEIGVDNFRSVNTIMAMLSRKSGK